ncbi:MAG: hypothetical protein JSS53_08605, partial [Proteobacteria bacterium]|nr:hypothetical protein [Pseudomonadota bacterium]
MGKTDKLTKNIQNAQKTLEEAKKLLEKNKPENALKEVNKSIELNATSKAYILRAQIYCLLGKCTLAFLDCQQVASMSGCTNDIKAQLTELRGDLYYTWGISEAALSEYSNASLAQLSRNSLTSNNTASFEAIPNNSDSGELSIRKEHTEPFLKAELPRKLRALRSSLSIAKESPSYLKASRIPSTNQTDQNLLKIDALRLNYFLTSTVISLLKNTRPELGTAQIFKTQKHWADFQNFFIGVEHTADFVEFFEYNLELLKGELRDRGVSNDNAANILAYDPLRKEFKRLFEEFRQLWLMQVDSKKPNYDPAIEKFADMIDLAGDRYEYIADLELSEFSTSTANSKPDRNSKAISKADNPIIKEIETQAIKGHSTCLYIRAYVHKHGLFGLERSDENAQADYALSSKKNDPRSMFIHRSSTEVIEAKKSEKLQSELLQSAVKKQYIRAILEQSKDFANTNNANRIADLDSAVTQSVAEACYELAGIYTTHFDNLSEQAIQLYLRAIELNYRPACRALARLYKQL